MLIPSIRWNPGPFGELMKLQIRLMLGSYTVIILGFIAPIVLIALSGIIDAVISGSEIVGVLGTIGGFSGFALSSVIIVNGLIVMPQVFFRQRRSGMLKLYRVSPFGFTELFGAYWIAASIMTLSAIVIGLVMGVLFGLIFGGFDWVATLPTYLLQLFFGAIILVPLGFGLAGYFRSAVGTALSGAGITIGLFAIPILEIGFFSVSFVNSALSRIPGVGAFFGSAGTSDSAANECTIVMFNFVSNYYVGLGSFASPNGEFGELISSGCGFYEPWLSIPVMFGYAIISIAFMRLAFRWE